MANFVRLCNRCSCSHQELLLWQFRTHAEVRAWIFLRQKGIQTNLWLVCLFLIFSICWYKWQGIIRITSQYNWNTTQQHHKLNLPKWSWNWSIISLSQFQLKSRFTTSVTIRCIFAVWRIRVTWRRLFLYLIVKICLHDHSYKCHFSKAGTGMLGFVSLKMRLKLLTFIYLLRLFFFGLPFKFVRQCNNLLWYCQISICLLQIRMFFNRYFPVGKS